MEAREALKFQQQIEKKEEEKEEEKEEDLSVLKFRKSLS